MTRNATRQDSGYGRQQISTPDLWEETNQALRAHRWSQARSLLDDLGMRQDNRRLFLSAGFYGVPEMIRQLVQDRIDLVNSNAMFLPESEDNSLAARWAREES